MNKLVGKILYISGLIVISCVVLTFAFTLFLIINAEKHCSSIKKTLEEKKLFGADIQIVINEIGIPDKVTYHGILGYSEKENSITIRPYPDGAMIYSTNLGCIDKAVVNIFGGCKVYFNNDDKVTGFREFLY